jgi:signal transduction histidine kinase
MVLPFWSAVLIALVSTPAALVFYGADAPLALSIFAFVSLTVLEVYVAISRRLSLSTVPALILQLTVFAIAGFASSYSIAIANLDAGTYPTGRIVTLAVIIGLGVFVGQLRQTHRAATEDAAREVNAQLELLNSQARRELWLNRRRIATVLHGPVQAALYASAMRLAQAVRPSKKLIQTVTADLENALVVLKFDSIEAPDLKSVLSQISEVWAGTCDIYLNIPKSVFQATKKNALLSEAVVEVMREGISNAIKHGQATEIEVEAKISEKLIELSIVNNGKAPVNKAGKGFGSKLYDELTLDWSLSEMADGRTKFGATIFIA